MDTKRTAPRPSTLKSLEALRILAAVAVVLAHSSAFHIPVLQPFIGASLFLGAYGVDIFFVISGFVMGVATLKTGSGTRDAWDFIYSRLLRLVPLYTLVTLAAAVYFKIIGRPWEWPHLLESLVFLPTWGQDRVLDPLVAMGWTLRFEMYFYLLVAAGIALNRKLLVPVGGIALSFAAWLATGWYFGAPLVFEFIVGFLLCVYRERLVDGPRARLGAAPFLAGLAVSVGLLLLGATGHDFGGASHGLYSQAPRLWIVYTWGELPRILAWGVPASLVVYCCLALERDLKWRLALPVAEKLNKFSWMPSVVAFAIGWCIMGVAAVLSLRFIEQPFLKLRGRRPAPRVEAAPPQPDAELLDDAPSTAR